MGKVILTVKFFFGNKKTKTKYIPSTLNPVWNHIVSLPKGTPTTDFTVEVWDHDTLRDDFLGIVELQLDLTKPSSAIYPLNPRTSKKDKGIKGNIEIKVDL